MTISVINNGMSALVPQNLDTIKKVGFVQNMNLKQLFVTTSITETGDPLQKGIGIKHQTNGRTFGFHNDSL